MAPSMRLIELAIPLRRPFANARGPVSERRLVLVGITEAGITGWGEAAPYPGLTTEDVDDVWNALRSAGIGAAHGDTFGLPASAAAAVDQARLDLAARIEGVSLRTYLGGAPRPVRACEAIGLEPSPAATVRRVESAINAGISEVKVKIEPGRDFDYLRSVREQYPTLRLAADANGSYHANDPFFDMVDDLALIYLEQPLPAHDLAGHRSLRNRLETPVCLDESTATEAATLEALGQRAAAIVSLKPGLVGPTSVRRLIERAGEVGAQVKIGGLVETSVGRAHALALCGSPHVRFTDLAPPLRFLAHDVSSHPWACRDGRILPLGGHGIGINVHPRPSSPDKQRELQFPMELKVRA